MTWLDGFERVTPAPGAFPGTMVAGAPRRFVCHTTEGLSSNPAATAARHPNPPHLWVTLPSHPHAPARRVQIFPLDVSARALSHASGDPETNKQGAIQVEVEGFAAEAGGWSADDLDWLADFVIGPACAATGVDVSVFIQGEEDSRLAAGRGAPTRMSWAQWAGFNGLCGHQNVPGNDHWDAGGLDLAHISRRLTHQEAPVTPEEIEQVAARVVAHLANPQTNPGTIIDGGARAALGRLDVAVNDPTSGVRALLLAQHPAGVDPAAIAQAVVEALPAELAGQVSDEIGRRLSDAR